MTHTDERHDHIPSNIWTIIKTNYLRDIRDERIAFDCSNEEQTIITEIVNIRATDNEIPMVIMVDTGANISLISNTELDRIQKLNEEKISTLPVNNISLI